MRAGLIYFTLFIFSLPASAQQAEKDVFYLVKDCGVAGYTKGVDCFEDIASLQLQLWGGSAPRATADSPKRVEIGAGDFAGPLVCNGAGFVSFRGAGRNRTRIVVSDPGPAFGFHAILVTDCDSLEFQDLSVVAEDAPLLNIGVQWKGGGSSTWTNVDMKGRYAGWYDNECSGDPAAPPEGEHRFFGVNIVSGWIGYYAECGATWMYGSEVRIDVGYADLANPSDSTHKAVAVAHRGDVRIYGSAIRVGGSAVHSASRAIGVMVGPSFNTGTPLGAGHGNGTFHMHGGVIVVDTSGAPGVDALGMLVDDNGGTGHAMGHTPDTAFMLKASPGATVTRLAGTGQAMSPFLWQSGSTEPVGGLASLTGQDLFVETDCDDTGDCSGSGTPPLQPHLMIYSASCASRWFDTVTRDCRPQ
jgi:hypothetical protein